MAKQAEKTHSTKKNLFGFLFIFPSNTRGNNLTGYMYSKTGRKDEPFQKNNLFGFLINFPRNKRKGKVITNQGEKTFHVKNCSAFHLPRNTRGNIFHQHEIKLRTGAVVVSLQTGYLAETGYVYDRTGTKKHSKTKKSVRVSELSSKKHERGTTRTPTTRQVKQNTKEVQ